MIKGKSLLTLVTLFFIIIGLSGCGGGGGGGGSTSSTASISGNIEIDNVIQTSAKVYLVNTLTGQRIESTTGMNGEFSYSGVIPGRYYLEYDDPKYGIITNPLTGAALPRDVTAGQQIQDMDIIFPSLSNPAPPEPPNE
jgi:hypothetical protein